MIIGSIFLLVGLIWAFDRIRLIAAWILPPMICLVAAFWINYACQIGSFEKGFYQLIFQLGVQPAAFANWIPYVAAYTLVLTFLHCFRRRSCGTSK